MFGIKKSGAGISYKFDNLSRLQHRMAKKSFAHFLAFYKSNRPHNLDVILRWFTYLWYITPRFICYLFAKMGIWIGMKSLGMDAPSNPGAPSYLFRWGIDEMVNRYKKSGINKTED